MTTHNADINVGATGLTLTTELFAVGSDTVAYTASGTTAQTNRLGFYRASFTTVAAGEYDLITRVGSLQKAWYRVRFAGTGNEVAVLVGRALTDSGAPIAPASATTAIQAKTDQLTFTVANKVDATAVAELTQNEIDSIGESIAEHLADQPIVLQSPTTDDGKLDLMQGVDYYTNDGREIAFTFERDYVPDSCKLTIASGEVRTITSTDIEQSSGSGSGRFHVRFDLPRTTGDELDPGSGSFEVISVLSNGREVGEIAEGVVTIRRRLTA